MRPALRTDTGPPRIVRSWVSPWLQPNKRSGGESERKRDKKVTHNAVKLAPFAAERVEAGSACGTERLTAWHRAERATVDMTMSEMRSSAMALRIYHLPGSQGLALILTPVKLYLSTVSYSIQGGPSRRPMTEAEF